MTLPIFLNKDEIVTDLLNTLSGKDLVTLKQTKSRDLIRYHSTVGMWIRNHYMLWLEENPYTDASDPNGDLHPDQVSMEIIKKLHTRMLNEQKDLY